MKMLYQRYQEMQFCIQLYIAIWERYFLKRGMTWNNLKRHTTSNKRPEMTYNEQETTWSNLKQAVNELKWPMTSKAQPTTTWTYQQWIKEDPKWPTTSKFWDYFKIRCNWFSSLTRFPAHLLREDNSLYPLVTKPQQSQKYYLECFKGLF